jgi:hypothetical protein
VPSAKADSNLSTFAFPALPCRAFTCRHCETGALFIPERNFRVELNQLGVAARISHAAGDADCGGVVAKASGGDIHRMPAAGHNGNRYGVKNEESEDHPDIFVCGAPRLPWPEFWKDNQRFGEGQSGDQFFGRESQNPAE